MEDRRQIEDVLALSVKRRRGDLLAELLLVPVANHHAGEVRIRDGVGRLEDRVRCTKRGTFRRFDGPVDAEGVEDRLGQERAGEGDPLGRRAAFGLLRRPLRLGAGRRLQAVTLVEHEAVPRHLVGLLHPPPRFVVRDDDQRRGVGAGGGDLLALLRRGAAIEDEQAGLRHPERELLHPGGDDGLGAPHHHAAGAAGVKLLPDDLDGAAGFPAAHPQMQNGVASASGPRDRLPLMTPKTFHAATPP